MGLGAASPSGHGCSFRGSCPARRLGVPDSQGPQSDWQLLPLTGQTNRCEHSCSPFLSTNGEVAHALQVISQLRNTSYQFGLTCFLRSPPFFHEEVRLEALSPFFIELEFTQSLVVPRPIGPVPLPSDLSLPSQTPLEGSKPLAHAHDFASWLNPDVTKSTPNPPQTEHPS